MAARRRKPTFRDFYGELETESKSGGSSGAENKDPSRNRDSPRAGTHNRDAKTSTEGELATGSGGKKSGGPILLSSSSDTFAKGKRSDGNESSGRSKTSGGRKTTGKGETYGDDGAGGISAKGKKCGGDKASRKGGTSGEDGISGSGKTSGGDGNSSRNNALHGVGIPRGKKTTKYLNGKAVVNIEWAGGAGRRVYRRPMHVAHRMTIETCPDGEKVKRTETDVMSRPSNVCGQCRKTSSEPFKRCSRCLAVSYCSRECQKGEFKSHKTICWHIHRYDIARARVYPAVRFFLDLRHAKDYSVLLHDMPTEEMYHQGAQCNLLVEVLGKVYHYCRYSCLVMDVGGVVTRLIVHDERNLYTHPSTEPAKPRPSSVDASIRPGDFLLLMGAFWRNFSDGRPGIRINDLNSVYVINMADLDMHKDYKQFLEHVLQSHAGNYSALDYRDLMKSLFQALA